MKQSKRILAYSALALVVMLAAFGAIAFDTSNVAYAQGPVPAAPTLTAEASGATTIDLSWNAVDDAARYELWAWDSVDEWRQLGGATLTGTSYSHTGLTSGTTYYYQIRAIDADGGMSGWSDRVNEVAGDMVPDEPVLTATAGFQQITVSWPSVTGATRYELWAWDGNWDRLDGGSADPLTDNFYVHTGLSNRTYYYQGRAVDSAGVMSAWSEQVSAEVLSSPNISAPTLSAARGDQKVTLSWTATTAPAGQTIASYEYRHAASGETLPGTWTNVGNVLTTEVGPLTNGTTYNFEVQAVSNTGATGNAGTASATPSTVPGAPSLTATPDYKRITLNWTAPSENGGATIMSYRLERQNDDGSWTSIYSPPAGVTRRVDTGLADSTSYTYRIFAINVAGDSEWTSASAITLAQAPQKPSAPTSSAVTPGPGTVKLDWDEPAFSGGVAISDYEYRYKLTNGGSWTGWRSVGTDTEVTVENLKPVNSHDFEVRAENSVGFSPVLEMNGIPLSTKPTRAPTTLKAVVEDTDTADDGLNLDVVLTWTVLTAGDTDVNGGTDINAYVVQWTEDVADDESWVSTDLAPATDSATAATTSHEDVDPGTTYYYRIAADNGEDEDGDLTWSAPVSVVVPSNGPGTPAAPTLEADVNSITITWAAPMTTDGDPVVDDGGSAITSYDIWVGTTAAEVGDVPNLTPTITGLPAKRTVYEHTGLRATTEYFYRVRARNAATRDGDDGIGEWSPEASATTTEATAGTPLAPTEPVALAPTSDGTVRFQWEDPDNQGATPLTGFVVQFQRDDDNDATDGWADATTVTIDSPTTLFYEHKNVEGGTDVMWEYQVQAVNSSGGGAWARASVPVPARAPSPPVLTATALSDTEILLEWSKPIANGSNIDGYEVQMWDGDDFSNDNLLAGITDTSETTAFTVSEDLTGGTEYFFIVRALTDTADEGLWSSGGAAVPTDTTDAASVTTADGVPGAPTLALGTVSSGDDPNVPTHNSITFTWERPANGGSDTTSYEIRRWNSETSAWVAEATVPADADKEEADTAEGRTYSYADEGLLSSTRYYYIARAINSAGAGPWSDTLSGVTTGGNPDAPMLSAALEGTSAIKLSWNVPNNNGTAITGYELQRRDSDDDAWGTNLIDAGVIVTEYVDRSSATNLLVPGETYYYRVRAVPQSVSLDDDADTTDEGWSAEDRDDAASETIPGDVPGLPDSFAATVNSDTDTTIDVMWGAPDVTGGSEITGYELRIWDTGSRQWVLEASPGKDDTTYADVGLDKGKTYYYILRAKNSQGNGPWTSYDSADTGDAAPDAPVLTAMATGIMEIRLTWTVPNDNGMAITGYELVRWNPVPDPPAWTDDLLTVTTGEGSVTLFIDSGSGTDADPALEPGKTYYYRIRTAPESDWSAVVSAATIADSPARPVLSAEADGENAIDLTWTAPDSGGNAIVRYELERWDTDTKQWASVTNALSATSTSYKHSGLDAGSRNIYRLRAVNRAPTDGGLGDWSTIASATTDAAE